MDKRLLEENACIISRIARDRDLSHIRSVDFNHLFADKPSAKAFAALCATDGYRTGITEIDDSGMSWDVTVSKDLMPSADVITACEEHLSVLAAQHGGEADGWGFFSD